LNLFKKREKVSKNSARCTKVKAVDANQRKATKSVKRPGSRVDTSTRGRKKEKIFCSTRVSSHNSRKGKTDEKSRKGRGGSRIVARQR